MSGVDFNNVLRHAGRTRLRRPCLAAACALCFSFAWSFSTPADCCRRDLLVSSLGFGSAALQAPQASAELLPAPPEGTCAGCLGVVDQLLVRCRGDLKGCVSSQDDRPEVFEPPWQLQLEQLSVSSDGSTDFARSLAALKAAVKKEGGRIVSKSKDKRYLRAEFLVDVPLLGQDADDVEWYFTPDDSIVQFRAERRSGGPDFGRNRQRLEAIRVRLGWEVMAVLRNRQRALFFAESPFDSFGPALYDQLRPGQDPTPGEAAVLAKQGEQRKDGSKPRLNLFSNDDLGAENLNGVLDATAREFLRAKCDPKLQICE